MAKVKKEKPQNGTLVKKQTQVGQKRKLQKHVNGDKMAVKSEPKKNGNLNSVSTNSRKIRREKYKNRMKKPGNVMNGKAEPGCGKGAKNTEDLINQLLSNVEVKKEETGGLQGFKIIKWKINPQSMATHHLFFKRHETTISDLSREKPPGRTILCHNVPPYFEKTHLREIFQTFGVVTGIFLHQKPTTAIPTATNSLFPTEKDIIRGFKVAYVVFDKIETVNEILSLSVDDVEPVIIRTPLNTGFSQWVHSYNSKIVKTCQLEKSVRRFMENFDMVELKKKEMEKMADEPDDDGWVTVTRSSGKKSSSGLVRSETMEQRLREKKRKQEKQLMNINPAQMKESKLKQLTELKKKFEEDKKRVELLKQQRKFKPF